MTELKRLCECKTVTKVARDGYSTCGQCGGMDAYKKSPRRKSFDQVQSASQVDWEVRRVMDISIGRSQEVLREKGRQLSFDDLLAAVYFQGWQDAQNKESES